MTASWDGCIVLEAEQQHGARSHSAIASFAILLITGSASRKPAGSRSRGTLIPATISNKWWPRDEQDAGEFDWRTSEAWPGGSPYFLANV